MDNIHAWWLWMTSGKKKFSKSNLNELVDDQVGIAEAQPQRDQMQPSLPAFLACCWWSSWLGSLSLVVTTSKSRSLRLQVQCWHRPLSMYQRECLWPQSFSRVNVQMVMCQFLSLCGIFLSGWLLLKTMMLYTVTFVKIIIKLEI